MSVNDPCKCAACGTELINLGTTCPKCHPPELILAMCNANDDLQVIRESLGQLSAFYVDWEKLYFEPGYHPDFPKHLTDSLNALARVRKTILKYAEPTQ